MWSKKDGKVLQFVPSLQTTAVEMTLQLHNEQHTAIWLHLYPPCTQRCDRRHHPAAARSPDGPVGHAGTAAYLPPQHHPLHRGDFNPAVNDRNNGSYYSGSGCIAEQVTSDQWSLLSENLIQSFNCYFFPHVSSVLSGVCGNTFVASACVCFCWFSQCSWLIKSPSSSTWTSGSLYWCPAACWHPFR